MQTPRWPLALIALAALPAITSPAIGQRARYHGALPALDSARLMADLSALSADSMEGRRVGTPGGARARAYLVRAIARIGLAPAGDSLAQPFTFGGRDGSSTTGVNLVAMIRGTTAPERVVVVSAHYDHVGMHSPGVNGDTIWNGADDNASGTSALLAIAAWCRAHPPRNTIVFAWFDGEESGLRGAVAFLAHPPVPLPRIVANVNLDMVGRNAQGELYAAGAAPWPVMRPLLDATSAVAEVKLRLGHDTGSGQENWIGQSDQGPFHAHGIPFVYFGVEDHPDYHQPSDEFSRIEPGFFVRSARTVAEFVRRLDAGLDAVAAVRR
ncbi:MAG: M28 family peptidase [Gemmatimonadetes bacterium]|nr:M28 family peptidase [Gemmatimonadota bacterium]